jgi:hypothetical protein
MTTKSWPESILGRAVLRQGFQHKPQSAIERTDMDSGLARGRLFNSNPLARVPCRFRFTEFQTAFFAAWYQDTARRGAAWFTINLPIEGVQYREVLARCASEPVRTPRGSASTIVEIEFEIHDSVVLPDGIVDLVLTFGSTGVQEAAAALDGASLQPAFDAWAVGFGEAEHA